MSDNPTLNEWNFLRDQFDALVREGSGIEVIFDAEFSRRFAELINRVIEPERLDRRVNIRNYTRPTGVGL